MILVFALAALPSCDGGGEEAARQEGPEVAQGIRGRVEFEKRIATDAGLSGDDDVVVRPARHIRVSVVLDSGGVLDVLGTTYTDADGFYGIGGAFPEGAQVAAYSNTEGAPQSAIQCRVEDGSERQYVVLSPPGPEVPADGLVTVNVRASVDPPDRAAGAFNILDVVQSSLALWLDVTGEVPFTAVCNWEVGAPWNTSFFDPAAGQRGELFFLGGTAGLEDVTDTDEFDDTVIAHETGHFITYNHSTTASLGGPHSGENLQPNLAYDEGFATWYAAIVLGDAAYRDTIGNASGATVCSICDDLESSRLQRVVGIGSEQSCFELLWDLTDGSAVFPLDRDNDEVAVDPGEILRAVDSFDPRSDYPYLLTTFDRVVASSLVDEESVRRLFLEPEDQDITYPGVERDSPPTGRDLFPISIAPGSRVSGFVDSLSIPPGGRNVEGGFDSSRYYRLRLDAGRSVTVRLSIDSRHGTAPEDLDLFLLDTQNRVIGSSQTEQPTETVTSSLPAGVYIVLVRSFFRESGELVANRAAFELEVLP